ncbi:uncharacterized protein LOC103929897 [Pyrus x bretschneideri]|uniref:uncharacterized protein LOC103929897 n=1 Tax=Pyrus x bretschneideri TaxID=225117 RepID=UPI00202F2264|nr:uncharacterized protein LOC103929897 [Pyrus x bretschneideri]
MVDESRDISTNEQMAVILHYMDNKGQVIERFMGVQHVTETTLSKLKESIDEFLKLHDLSYSNLQGQGYDGASNMRDCYNDSAGEAKWLLKDLQSFDFVFLLFLMKSILGVGNDLSQALQKKDQEIVNAMALVKTCKEQLRCMRNDENFDLLVDKVSSFCVEHEIEVPNMDDLYVIQGKSLRKAPRKTNIHHYKVELFFEGIDFQLTEIDDPFAEGNTELLIFLACLSPNDSFVVFDKEKLVRLA